MMDKSTIYALINFSESERGFSDESIQAAFRVRARRKQLELAQQTFFGSLELRLFSGFDLAGGESMMALQHRLASELVPHDVPDETDIGPLLDIIQENVAGRHVAWYRYLLCDAASANLFSHLKDEYSGDKSGLRRQLRRTVLLAGNDNDAGSIRSTIEEIGGLDARALFDIYRIE